jgi:general secretion pathway protein G
MTERNRLLAGPIESLLLIVLIVYIIASMVAPRMRVSDGPHIAYDRSHLATLRGVLTAFHEDTGRDPTTQEGFDALFTCPPGLKNWKGPYLSKPVPLDTWRRPYAYRSDG